MDGQRHEADFWLLDEPQLVGGMDEWRFKIWMVSMMLAVWTRLST